MANWGGDGNLFQKLIQSLMQGRNAVNQDLINTGVPAQLGRAIGGDLYNFTQSPIGRGISNVANRLTAPTDQRDIQERILKGLIQGGNLVNPGGLETFTQPTPAPGRAPGLQSPVRPVVAPPKPASAVSRKASATARVTSRVTRSPKTAPVAKPKVVRPRNRGY